MPQLSVVVTAYNVEDHIETCLVSIFAQTFSDYELIIVDDASLDRSAEIAEKLCEDRENCRVIRLTENTPGGAGAPSNIGIEASTGDYVGFVDGDDFAAPSMFAELMAVAARDKSDIVMCQYQNFVEDGDIHYKQPADAKRWHDLLKSESQSNQQQFKLDVLKMISVPWRKIYSRDFLNTHHIRFPEGDFFYEDNPFHWFTTYCAERIALVPSQLIFHRVNRAGQTMSTRDARLLRMFSHFDTILAFLTDQRAPRVYRVQLCRWAISQMEWISEQLDAQFREQLYDDFSRCLATSGAEMVREAVQQQYTGRRGAALTWFALTGRKERFLQQLEGKSRLSVSERISILQLRSGFVAPIHRFLAGATSMSAQIFTGLGSIFARPAGAKFNEMRSDVDNLKRNVKALQRMVRASQLERLRIEAQESRSSHWNEPSTLPNPHVPKSVREGDCKGK